jgi:hypothetical protein
VAPSANFPQSYESSEIIVLSKWISGWEIRKSLLERGQVSRVAEEAQLCSCWPKCHESVAMHQLAHCNDGGPRSCFSTTEIFFSLHFLLGVSALRDNTSDLLFAPVIVIIVGGAVLSP